MITKSQLNEMLKNKSVTVDTSGTAVIGSGQMINTIESRINNDKILKFTVPGIPVSCPRMTQRDKWMKRPCVVKYRDYADRLRSFINLHDLYVGKVTMKFYMPMPESWSLKKIQLMGGKIHRSKPDWDNLAKGVCDALLKQDSMIWSAYIQKFWALPGTERTELTFED